jgi:ribonucleoside-diphosphate reductase beta chain
MKKINLFSPRSTYKPFEYPWAYDAYLIQHQMHWLVGTIQFADDISDWGKLTKRERKVIQNILRLFTQMDVAVASGHLHQYAPYFQKPELLMMCSAFAAIEGVHMAAYSTLIEELGFSDTEYSEFLSIKEMYEKYESLVNLDMMNFEEKVLTISVCGEGIQLFGSFSMLFYFTKIGLMKGMGQVVSYSLKDEYLHCTTMIKVLLTYLQESGRSVDIDLAHRTIKSTVELESAFIDMVLGEKKLRDLSAEDVKGYIRYIADTRCQQLGIPLLYNSSNPLPWMDELIYLREQANFFEVHPTSYTKGGLTGDW